MTKFSLLIVAIFISVNSFSQIIFPRGSTWKYTDSAIDQGTAWRNSDFDDSGWKSGKAQLGFGDGDEVTLITKGAITYYFRKKIEVNNPSVVSGLIFYLLRDDGAVIYINGVQVVRSNMPVGTISYSTLGFDAGDENKFWPYIIEASYLTTGSNTIAVEVHQAAPASIDLSFDLEMRFFDPLAIPIFSKSPYLLYPGDNTKMLIMWQTFNYTACTFKYGNDTVCTLGSISSVEYDTSHQHKVILEGLTPGTKYFYKVIADSLNIRTGNFISGASDTTKALSFYAYGDTRSDPSAHNFVAQKIIEDVKRDTLSQTFIVASGDIVNDGDSESSWTNEFFDPQFTYIQQMMAQLPYLCALGNHEGQGLLFAKYFPYPMFTTSRYYYSFDYGPVHFSVIDQLTSYAIGSAQYDWLVNDLASSTKPWKILMFHYPGWTTGQYANDIQVQTVIQPLCLTYGVQIVINGHNHLYSRANVDEVMHITTGGGGAPLYGVVAGRPNIVKADKSYHYCKIDIKNDILVFTAKRKDGTIIESFDYNIVNTPTSISEKISPSDDFRIYTSKNTINVDNINNLNGSFAVFDNWGRVICKKKLSGISNNIIVNEQGAFYVRINYGSHVVVKKVILLSAN